MQVEECREAIVMKRWRGGNIKAEAGLRTEREKRNTRAEKIVISEISN